MLDGQETKEPVSMLHNSILVRGFSEIVRGVTVHGFDLIILGVLCRICLPPQVRILCLSSGAL